MRVCSSSMVTREREERIIYSFEYKYKKKTRDDFSHRDRSVSNTILLKFDETFVSISFRRNDKTLALVGENSGKEKKERKSFRVC